MKPSIYSISRFSLIGILFILPCAICLSQNIRSEINEQVWNIQLRAMNNLDSNGFMSTMSKDVIQVSYDRNTIRDYNQFAKQVNDTYRRIKERNLTRNMEFRFLKRIVAGPHAFENGFYKYELTNENSEKTVFYGAFQVVLRKENGTWKVLVDYDADTYNGEPVTAELFNKALAMDAPEK